MWRWEDMTLLGRIKDIFSATRRNDGVQVNTAISRDKNSELFIEFKSCLYNLLKKDDYISKKEYMPLIEKNKELISSFNVLRSTGMIHSYAIKNGLDINDIDYVLDMVYITTLKEIKKQYNAKNIQVYIPVK